MPTARSGRSDTRVIEDRMNVNDIEAADVLVQPRLQWSRIFESVSPLDWKEMNGSTVIKLWSLSVSIET
jgi:hypothetical protein